MDCAAKVFDVKVLATVLYNKDAISQLTEPPHPGVSLGGTASYPEMKFAMEKLTVAKSRNFLVFIILLVAADVLLVKVSDVVNKNFIYVKLSKNVCAFT